MSIARQLFREFRPLFHMLEEPFGRAPVAYGLQNRSAFDHPFFQAPTVSRPAIDLTEDADNYIVEADLPGVKKDDIEVRAGDGGRSITIEGRMVRRSNGNAVETTDDGTAVTAGSEEAANTKSTSKISSERLFSGSSTFTRTVWLPRAIDGSKVSAKLNDGILTLTIPKMEDKESVKIEVL
ncbi:hypothetical protein SERLA73DRAFT_183388 [Serpula lacrymans var. lacrymans S7.3]|uniref:SHSP domain-containing protein n=2 Tax=Serpula lacrymans var. lacrymans TaxID=341189 RepID=F8PZS7_SERL3|nr:uncharacterized protein SERLADRAFT_470483 [Serpula lacrymans var. lacrymans S7.9]EGN98399.1 hypothetical protein SERLA73DRAFT_183388 [Serpula lacrymans var. lacrymans S7.3]EGO23951.1 hypothetical protein SERLADRAFT_470483 [Serpula lacrymans var. lacrymans S7.9]